MIQDNEVVMLVLGLGTLAFFVIGRPGIKALPRWGLFLLSFVVLITGWVLTILEGFILADVLNVLEHICYAASSILLCVWCWQVCGTRREVIR